MLLRILTIFLTLWAIFSLATWGYYHWIDLRFLPPLHSPLTGNLLGTLWSLSLPAYLLYRIFAPPFAPCRCRNLRLLLVPTMLMLVGLLVSSAYYYYLMLHRYWEGSYFPITLFLFLLYGYWCLRAWRDAYTSSRSTVLTAPLFPLWGWKTITTVTLSTAFCAWFFLWQFHQNPPPFPPSAPVDLAVVLGNGVDIDSNARPLLKNRVAGAAELYQQGRARLFLMSGATHQIGTKTVSEPIGMQREARKLGLPEEAILLDPSGINTRATAANTARLMKKMNLSTVVAISNDCHLPRLRQAFADEGITAYTYACPQDWSAVDPMWLAREVTGYWVYRFSPTYRSDEVIRLQVAKPRLVVYKSAGKLELYDGSQLVKTYVCITGKNSGDKQIEGDMKTPEGTFHIVVKNPESKYHVSLGIDYPSRTTAEHALIEKAITTDEYHRIIHALDTTGIPDWHTPLGGEIFLHGHAEGRTGTHGCIALSNHDIEELYMTCDLGTEIEIKP